MHCDVDRIVSQVYFIAIVGSENNLLHFTVFVLPRRLHQDSLIKDSPLRKPIYAASFVLLMPRQSSALFNAEAKPACTFNAATNLFRSSNVCLIPSFICSANRLSFGIFLRLIYGVNVCRVMCFSFPLTETSRTSSVVLIRACRR